MQEWTYDLAMAAGRDAGSANMRQHGRRGWNEDDYNVATRTFHRLYPLKPLLREALDKATMQNP